MPAGLLESGGVRRLSADRAHRRPHDGAGPAAPAAGPSIPPVGVDVTGTGRRVTTGAGLADPVTMHPRGLPAVEVVVVPALGTMTAADTPSALAARYPGGHQGRRHVTGEDYHQRWPCLVPLMSGFATPLIGMTGADKHIHRIGGQLARCLLAVSAAPNGRSGQLPREQARPYGNSSVFGDIAEILGVPDSEWADEGLNPFVDAEWRFLRLHVETAIALQITLATGEFRTGRYMREEKWDTRGWKRDEASN